MEKTLTTFVFIFWITAFFVFYTYIGYGIILYIIVRIKRMIFRKNKNAQKELPEISFLVAAYNEEDYIQEKMNNTLSLNYPKEKLHIIWVTDGSTDSTCDKLKEYKEVVLLHQQERQGKTAAINRAMKFITTPITVFTDANTMICKDSLLKIAECFADSSVGCVAGEKRVKSSTNEGIASGGEGAYWKYESCLKRLDNELYSTMGAAGELYGIRTELFKELPSDTLLDDFILSMLIVKGGKKIAYCKEAYAIESGSANLKEEEKRKIRIAAGGIQSIIRLRSLLNPFKYGIITFQYISHRVLRWSITPICLFLLVPINTILVLMDAGVIYTLTWILQIIFYSAACAMYTLEKRNIKNKVLYIPYYFIFMNLNVIKGFGYLYKRRNSINGAWEKAKRAK